jgi:glycosyltransferase involved in cell wall biosynthesis
MRRVPGRSFPVDGTERLPTSTTLSVIVPAYNEEYLIATSLARLKVLGESPLLRLIKVIVVDDASEDGTAEALGRFRIRLESEIADPKFQWIWLRHEENQGKGAAIRTALAHVDTKLVVIHDADLECHPGDLLSMVKLLLSEDADAVFGSRFMPGTHDRRLFSRHALGNRLLTFLCNMVCHSNLTDMETCYKMVRADLLKSIPLESSTFDVEPELVIKLTKRGSRIFEVPISYSGRTYREGKKINWKDGLRALRAILYFARSTQIYTAEVRGGEILERLDQAPSDSRFGSSNACE